YLSAAVLGPLGGGCVALVTDVLGQLVLPQGGSVNTVIAAGNFSSALVFGLIFKYMPVKSDSLRSVIAVSASAIVGTLGINSLGLYLYYYSSMPYLCIHAYVPFAATYSRFGKHRDFACCCRCADG
ncbi:MAG: hypothetical protein ACLUSP_00005, partial [Christensenellales bacterium]